MKCRTTASILFANNNIFSTGYATNGYVFLGQPIVYYGTPAIFGVQVKGRF
jgi:hypothetical protein